MKVAVLWLINERLELLLAKRAATMQSDPGVWGPSVAGKVEAAEDPKQAAIRETEEELGITREELMPVHFLHKTRSDAHQDGQARDFFVFWAELDSSAKIQPSAEEVAQTKWISLSDLMKEYEKMPESIVIAYDRHLWEMIFLNLQALLKKLQK